MIKGLVSATLCSIIVVFLQFLFWFTAPKITCNQIYKYLFQGIKSLAIEFLILILLLIVINKYISLLNRREHWVSLIAFTVICLIGFLYLFGNYMSKVCE
jgi:hypothetical protein